MKTETQEKPQEKNTTGFKGKELRAILDRLKEGIGLPKESLRAGELAQQATAYEESVEP